MDLLLTKLITSEDVKTSDIDRALTHLCEDEHSQCGYDCPVFSLNGGSVPNYKNTKLGCDTFKDGKKMRKFISDKHELNGLPKILIIGHARHGKDTLAEMMVQYREKYKFKSSSQTANEMFIFGELKDKYHYNSVLECFDDRKQHRKEWYDMIVDYNTPDKSKLAKAIMTQANIYVGMRDNGELQACIEAKLFDVIIWVHNPNQPVEPFESFSIDPQKYVDIKVLNDGSKRDLFNKVTKLMFEIKEIYRNR